MYIKKGIAYAGEPDVCLAVTDVRVLDDFHLLLTFSNGEKRSFDFKPLLGYSGFAALKDEKLFRSAYIDYGVVTWNEMIDIAPEALYKGGTPI